MSEFKTKRRFYLLKRLAAKAEQEPIEGVWRHYQEAETGTALAASFPSRAALVAAGYSTLQDIDGADAAELQRNAGLTSRQATAALTETEKALS